MPSVVTHSCHPGQSKNSRSALATFQVWDQSGLHDTMSQNLFKSLISLIVKALEHIVAPFGSWMKALFSNLHSRVKIAGEWGTRCLLLLLPDPKRFRQDEQVVNL